jgi:hypothetical protein
MKKVFAGLFAILACLMITGKGFAATPACTGTAFNDVTAGSVGGAFCGYIEEFSLLGITAGCGGGDYCPFDPVTRAQMAVFVTKALALPKGYATVALERGNYNSPLAAMDDLASWCGTPSNANPCLLKIMPGVYNLGGVNLVMQPFVDIEGSGENVTWITGQVSGDTSGVLVGADNSELRNLTVENTGTGAGVSAAVYIDAGFLARPRISNVTVLASGGSSNFGVRNFSSTIMDNISATAVGGNASHGIGNFAVVECSGGSCTSWDTSPLIRHSRVNAYSGSDNYGVYNDNSSAFLSDMMVSVSDGAYNYGVYCMDGLHSSAITVDSVNISTTSTTVWGYGIFGEEGCSMTVRDSTIEVTGPSGKYGILNANNGGDVVVMSSHVTASTDCVRNDSTSSFTVAGTYIIGPVTGTIKCAGVYDASYTFHANTCP